MNIEQLTDEEVKAKVCLEYFKVEQQTTNLMNNIIIALLEFEKETGISLGYKTYPPITTQETNPLTKLQNVYRQLQDPKVKRVKPKTQKQLDDEATFPWENEPHNFPD